MAKSKITYEMLMNHYVKFPNHSLLVHKLFNPYLVMLIVLCVTGITTYVLDGDFMFALIVSFLTACFLGIKMISSFNILHGHGIGIVKTGRFRVIGLPEKAFYVLLVPFVLIVILNILAFTQTSEFPSDDMRLKLFAGSFLFGFIMSLLSWRFHTYYETWYGSEYDARIEFKSKGYSEDLIENSIQELYKKGVLYKNV